MVGDDRHALRVAVVSAIRQVGDMHQAIGCNDLALGGQQGLRPAVDGHRAVQVHGRPGEDHHVVAVKGEVADPEPAKVEEVLAIARLLRRHAAQGQAARLA